MRLISLLLAAALFLGCEPPAEPPAPPHLSRVEPANGPTIGIRLTVIGTGFVEGSQVWIGPVELTDLEVTPTQITGVLSSRVPAGQHSARISGETGESEQANAYTATPWEVLSNEGMDDGGPVQGMLRDPETGRLYVWEALAVYRSDDGASHWTRIQKPGTLLFPVSMAAVPGAILLGGHIVYRSEDGGATWSVPDYNVGAGGSGSVFLAAHGSEVFAVNGTVVSRSSDGGRTWANVGNLPHAARDAAFHHATGTLLCATNDGLYWSADAGVTFSRATGIEGEVPRVMTAPGATRVWTSNDAQTYLSTDGGRTFSAIQIAGASRAILDAALLPGAEERWVVAVGKVYAQTEDGLGWTEFFTQTAATSILAEASGDVLVGTAGGVRRLYADGSPHQVLNTGMTSPELWTAFADRSDGRLYLGTASGALISRGPADAAWQLDAHAPEAAMFVGVSRRSGGGRTLYAGYSQFWQLDLGLAEAAWVAPLPSTPQALEVDPSGEITVAVAGGIWKRTLSGPWQQLTSDGLEGGTPIELRFVDDELYALVGTYPDPGATVYRLPPDAMATWAPVSPPVTITTGNGATVFEIADGAIFAGRGEQVYRYVPGGDSWALADPEVDFIAGMAVDPNDRRQVYSTGGRLRKSSDAGATWRDLPLVPDSHDYAHQVVVDGAHPGRVYFIGYYTVLQTDSGGE